MQSSQTIIKEYRNDLRLARNLKRNTTNLSDVSKINSIISSTEYSLFWLETGKEKRAGERRETRDSYDQRTTLRERIEDVEKNHRILSSHGVSGPVKLFIDEVMSQLSDRQRECYESVYLKGNTFDQTAKYLQISKGTVSTYIERADKKIQQYLKKRGVSDKRHLYSEGVINHE
ncbi:hypothetical protein I6N95_05070 [Vagococcus sp. BWB3-3]|uniref:RNA polymerase sigma factor 70 region 4 type 2 domain-containing protein n=1 Tax=Vagococcus allomyrinae TaxID=2794353 RepID=A0A940P5Z8_9ENTE|nr:hypothetical protein [Vagococcus allomyrinae]